METILTSNHDPAPIEHMLAVGRGGAIQRLLTAVLSGYRELVLDHCLHHKAYDRQCEGSRAGYLYPLLQHSDDINFYRNEIIQALLATKDFFDAEQLFEFAVLFARDGDSAARLAAYEKFALNDLGEPWAGATYLIEIDGIAGLLHTLDAIGSSASNLNSYRDGDYLVREAEKRCGVEEVRQALAMAHKKNPNIKAFLDSISERYTPSLVLEDVVKSHQHENSQPSLRGEESKGMTWREIRRSPDFERLLIPWAKSATEDEFANCVDDILEEKDPQMLASYLKIFSRRRFPRDPRILINLFDSPSLRISNATLHALSIIPHADVRALFGRLIQVPEWSVDAIELLRSNFHKGDDLTIKALLERQTDVYELHSLGGGLLTVYKHNPIPGAGDALLFLYENGPCALCRSQCVEMLRDLGQLPDWVMQECIYDSNEGLRSAAREWLEGER